MKDVLELIIANLVDNKEEISIEEISNNEKSVEFKVKVATSDMGKVIGKQGRVAKSIRTVMKSVAGKEGKKVNVEFVEE
ncbi:MAG: KH domain-containing protein [Clostridia bacterium]|nr:KH domain-containing protein [Clostridia bacterium]